MLPINLYPVSLKVEHPTDNRKTEERYLYWVPLIMKKYILSILMFIPIIAVACDGYVIGFKGEKDAFDISAFKEYVRQLNYCSKTYSWNQRDDAINFIKQLKVEYQLYGFSKGAQTVSYLIKHKKLKPEYVITIGAYKKTDVNFDSYEIKYNNYFDASGKGQLSPGTFLNVLHFEMQKEVNKIRNKTE